MTKTSDSLSRASVLIRTKESYLLWLDIAPHIPKNARYTIGTRIENKFLDLLDDTYSAYFSRKDNRQSKIESCVLTLDTLKFLLSIAWEAKLVSHKQYEDVSIKLNEVSKMLAGWQKYLQGNTFVQQTASSDSNHRPDWWGWGYGSSHCCWGTAPSGYHWSHATYIAQGTI